MKRKIISLILALAMVLGVTAVLASCGDSKKPDPNAKAGSFVTLDINPSIELTVDEDGYVLSAYGANEDGQVLLYGESGIVGVKLEDSVERITELAVELGYINDGNKVVSASVYSDSESVRSKLEGKIEASVNAAAKKAGLKLTVNSEELYSLLRELEAYKAQNPASAEIQALTPAKYRLAVSAAEGGEITLEAAISLDDQALIDRINEAHKQAEAFATKAFNKARAEAMIAYNKAIEIAQDAAYLEYFAQKFMTNPLANSELYLNASFYVAYANAEKGLEALELASEWLEENDYELNAEETAAVLAAFGLTEADKALIASSDGRVTIRSVEHYANKVLRNMSRAEREALEDRIDDLLDEAEDRIEVLVEAAVNDYKPQVEAIITSAEAIIAQLKLQAIAIPSIDAMISEFESVVAAYDALVRDGELSEDDIDELTDLFEDKAEDYKEALAAAISPEDKAAIEAKRTAIKEAMTAQRGEFEKELAAAEAEAKAYLEGLKNARRQ